MRGSRLVIDLYIVNGIHLNVLSYPNSLQIIVDVLKAIPFHLETLKSTNNN